VTASVAPPPISGGTLLVTHDGNTVVAADPDRDAVYVVDVKGARLLFTVALEAGDEPGRLVEDASGHVHVALRRGGALATIDPTTGTVTARRSVCPAPRGVAYDATADVVWVACATGELVSLPAAGGAATQKLVIERDLRDIVLQNGALAVTEFRSSEVLRVAADGTVTRRDAMQPVTPSSLPHVAWRAIAGPSGTIVVVHQEETVNSVQTQQPSAYGGLGSPPIVDSVLSMIAADGTSMVNQTLSQMVLPVDVALAPDGQHLAVVAAGSALVPGLPNLWYVTTDGAGGPLRDPNGQSATAVAFDAAGHLLVQVREPAFLYVLDVTGGQPVTSIALSSTSRDDTGHDVFHAQAGSFVACASCHPEGGDDGHVWVLDGDQRRTPSLRGTIAGTAPYHWPGDEPDLTALANDVYTGRMGGASLAGDQMGALKSWVEAIPAPPAPSWLDMASAQRGKAIFQRADVGCSTCHSGAKFTDNLTVDVGTGGSFQVPPLIGVGWRMPLLHSGCALSIADRFGACATPGHGSTAALAAQDLTDLGTYLESL